MTYRIGSLFSGYLGLDMAVSSVLDAETAWVSDVDKGASKILAHRTDAPNLGDLTAIDWEAVEPVDILTGGFPCQDLSHAGKRAGMGEGTRSGLWSYMAEAIDTLRPRLVVAENVRGLLSAEALRPVEPCTWCVGDDASLDLRALGAVLADLADIGYDATWTGLRAADVGAAHGRFRIFLIATPRHTDRLREPAGPPDVLLESRGGSTLRLNRPDRGPAPGGARDVALLPTPAVNDMGKAYTPEEWDAWTAKMQAAHGNGNGHGKSLEIEAARLLPTPVVTDVTGTRNKTAGRSPDAKPHAVGTTLGDVVYEQAWGDYGAAIARWENVTGRPAPAPTDPTGRDGAHRLSPRFTEWMMGLPDGWITDVPGITRNQALKACGNGVVPQQAAAALRWMLNASEAAA